MKKVGIIGHFCIEGNKRDGQTVKTREINKYLEDYLGQETLKYDTYKNSRNPIKIIKNTYRVIKNSENIILIVSRNGYRVLLPLIVFLNKFHKKKIFEFVVGGRRYELFDESKIIRNMIMRKLIKGVQKIYVETERIKNEYNKRKIYKVEVIPNFKDIIPIDEKEIVKDTNKDRIKVCTFTRVHPTKGIEEAIEAICNSNRKLNKEYTTNFKKI